MIAYIVWFLIGLNFLIMGYALIGERENDRISKKRK